MSIRDEMNDGVKCKEFAEYCNSAKSRLSVLVSGRVILSFLAFVCWFGRPTQEQGC
jgi:hypothetical protein